MYSRHATTCLILAVVHEASSQSSSKVGARGMWHGDSVAKVESVIDSLMGSGASLVGDDATEIVTNLYFVGAFNFPGDIKKAVVGAFNRWFGSKRDVRFVFEDESLFEYTPAPSSVPDSRLTWRIVVKVDKTEETNCDYKRVRNGELYSISCLIDGDSNSLKDENVGRLNADPSLGEGCKGVGVVLPFPICTGLLVRTDGSHVAFHDDRIEGDDVKRILDSPFPGQQRWSMCWLAGNSPKDDEKRDSSSLFRISEGSLEMYVPEYEVRESAFVKDSLRIFDTLDLMEKENPHAAEKLRINLMNNCSTSPWCENSGFEEDMRVGMRWWNGGGDDEGGVYRWSHGKWEKVHAECRSKARNT